MKHTVSLMKHYGQACAIARALDVVGERWSLLLVRELTLGPRRYRDLAAGLPGIPSNVLAARLKDLQ
ncbi:MAG TPA: helix-turn-helix domain-containing protein, partial [Streptosporangiaceae bacterium]|nr:helix-turn-helix domain-containing protein [Streptosporangiaceae bacterium]